MHRSEPPRFPASDPQIARTLRTMEPPHAPEAGSQGVASPRRLLESMTPPLPRCSCRDSDNAAGTAGQNPVAPPVATRLISVKGTNCQLLSTTPHGRLLSAQVDTGNEAAMGQGHSSHWSWAAARHGARPHAGLITDHGRGRPGGPRGQHVPLVGRSRRWGSPRRGGCAGRPRVRPDFQRLGPLTCPRRPRSRVGEG